MIHRFHYLELDDDPGRVDLDRIWTFMSEHAYWQRWRTREDVEKQIRGAWRVVGAYGRRGELIGFARAISDGVAFAYLADVYVDLDARGCGLGRELVRIMIDAGPGAEFRWALHTADAHNLYQRFGFARPDDTYLERPGAAAPPVPEMEHADTVRLGVADAGEVLTLQRAAYVTEAQAHSDSSLPPLTQSYEALRAELRQPQVVAWGIRHAGRLIAAVRVEVDGPIARIGRLVVAPDSQGRGHGTRLLHVAEQRCPPQVSSMELFTGEHSTANLRLYERLGYHETHRSPAGDYDLVHMAKSRSNQT